MKVGKQGEKREQSNDVFLCFHRVGLNGWVGGLLLPLASSTEGITPFFGPEGCTGNFQVKMCFMSGVRWNFKSSVCF